MSKIRITKDGEILQVNTAVLEEHLRRGWALLRQHDDDIYDVQSGAALTVDAYTARTWQIAMTAACTLALQASYAETAELTLIFQQPAASGYAVTWPAGVSDPPDVDTTPGAVTVANLVTYDSGQTWSQSGGGGTDPGTVETAENALVRSAGSGGNARGDGAVDLQRNRGANTQVASGDNAVIGGGYGNTSSGYASSVVGGYYNIASGDMASVLGGYSNIASGDTSSVMGAYMHAAGKNTHVFGVASSEVTFSQDDAFITYGLRAYLHAPNTAPTDADLKNSSISFWLDETNDALTFRVKYSDGTLKTGTVALT